MKNNLQTAIQAFSTKPLLEASIAFFSTLGYNTSLQNPLEIPTLQGFFDAYQGIETNINITPDLTKQIKEVQLLFQITQAQISSQIDVFGVRKVDNKIIESYLFLGIELAGKSYSRTQMSTIVRAINKGFPMPVIIVFKHHNCLTLSIIDRRINKKDENRDVLEKITFIKDINIQQPNRGHIEILEDLSFTELHRIHRFDNFVALHEAWRKTLDINVLNKKFYRELFTWYLWAVRNVKFPKPDNEPLSDEAHQSISVIRLLTRLIFVWFVKEKHLIKDDLFEENILKNYLKDFNPDSSETSDYYKAILQNLFFATLNSPMDRDAQTPEEKRGFIDRTALKPKGYSDNYLDHTKYRYANLFQDKTKALSLFEDIPFLNGGLFECLDSEVGDDAKTRTERRYDGFSDTAKNRLLCLIACFLGKVSKTFPKNWMIKNRKTFR
jgi:adenine-specific DNA-methyltransferase